MMSNAACATISIGRRRVIGEDGAEDQADHRGLLHAGQPLQRIVLGAEPHGGERDDDDGGGRARAEQPAQPLEGEAAKDRLLAESRADGDRIEDPRQRGSIAGQVVERLIDGVGAEQRHHDALHDQLERRAEEHTADARSATQRRGRTKPSSLKRDTGQPGPDEREDRAQRDEDGVAEQNDDNREQPQRSETTQRRGQPVVRRPPAAHRRLPASQAATSFSSRDSRVSSFFALTIHHVTSLRYDGGCAARNPAARASAASALR